MLDGRLQARRSNTFRLAKPTLVPILLDRPPTEARPLLPEIVAPPLPGIPALKDTATLAMAVAETVEPVATPAAVVAFVPAPPSTSTPSFNAVPSYSVSLRHAINSPTAINTGPGSRARSQTSTGVHCATSTAMSARTARNFTSSPVHGNRRASIDDQTSAAVDEIARTPNDGRPRSPVVPGSRDLIGEYLAAKTRAAHNGHQQLPIPPPIFHVNRSHSNSGSGGGGTINHHTLPHHHHHHREQRQRLIDELAYKHPILLMDGDNDHDDDDPEGVGETNDTSQEGDGTTSRAQISLSVEEIREKGRHHPSEARLFDTGDCSVEMLQDVPALPQQRVHLVIARKNSTSEDDDDDDDGEEANAAKESLIVPRTKMIAFHSLKTTAESQSEPVGGEEGARREQPKHRGDHERAHVSDARCRLVRKVNPNILKTWEQLSGGMVNANGDRNSCVHQRRPSSTGKTPGSSDPVEEFLVVKDQPACQTAGPRFVEPNVLDQPQTVRLDRQVDRTTHSSTGSLFSTALSSSGCESGDRQSCLLYCPQYPYNLSEELIEFKVNKLLYPPAVAKKRHHSGENGTDELLSVSSGTNRTTSTEEDGAGDGRTNSRNSTTRLTLATVMGKSLLKCGATTTAGPASSCTTTTVTTVGTNNNNTSSSDGADFYDSIDAVSTCVRKATGKSAVHNGSTVDRRSFDEDFETDPKNDDDFDEDDALGCYDDEPNGAGGEGLAEFTSLDRKRLMWSIEIE